MKNILLTLFTFICLSLSLAVTAQVREFSEYEERMLEAYLAYYGRPADSAGLAFWAQKLEAEGGNLDSVITAFGESEEFDSRFGDLDNPELVTNLYQQIFGRDPDAAGLAFYVDKLDTGTWTLQQISLSIIDGRQNDDVVIVDNRLDFSEFYVSGTEDGSVDEQTDVDLARVMATIDDTPESVDDSTAVASGEAAVVEGTVSSNGTALDDYVSLSFGDRQVPVSESGDFSVVLDTGSYDAGATRPGYEDFASEDVAVGADAAVVDFDIDMAAIAAGEYIGSSGCGVCHTNTYDSFIQTGHPFKLNRAFGEQPQYPFTSLDGVLERIMDEDGMTDNSLGTPLSYDDVSYVIGGYFWKARFLDRDGAVVTGSEVQYNFATDGMASYHDDEVDKPFNCGNCHTTGWRHTDELLNPASQDDMQHMHGTFAETGIQCESCHGGGSSHAQTMNGDDITEEAVPRTNAQMLSDNAGYGLPVACGECHTRDGERDYDSYVSGYDAALMDAGLPPVAQGGRILASGGLVRHHEQYDEILGIDPDTLQSVRSGGFMATHGDCGNCHDPHGSAVNVNNPAYTGVAGVDPENSGCLGCHSDYDPGLTNSGMAGLQCTDCHMPKMAKSAVATDAVGEGPVIGDVSSHIFKIGLDPAVFQQFTDDGKFAYPAVTGDWACRTCHNDVDVFGVDDNILDGFEFHSNVSD